MSTVLTLPSQLTVHGARQTLQALTQQLAAGQGDIEVDASGLTQIDSSAIAVLLDCRRQAQAQGRALRVRGAPARLTALASLYGVQTLLPAA